MKKVLILLCFIFLGFSFAQKPMNAPQIFQKKCAMCHNIHGPQTDEEKKAMVAPPITIAMKSVTIGTDAIEEPKTKEALRELTITFVKDYVMEPHEDKAYCEDTVFKRFNTMPSLKGFITQEQLDLVIPYVYDQFAPKYEEE